MIKVFVFLVALMCAFLCGLIVSGTLVLSEITQGSPAFGNWAMWFGSVGTLGTLIFLSWQYRHERQSRLDSESKQQAMWASQEEMLSFQKYQTHKSEYHSLLNQIQNSFDIEFTNREALYETIFPENNFHKCSVTINASNEKTSSGIKAIVNSYSLVWEQVSKFSSIDQTTDTTRLVVDYYSSIQQLTHTLNVKFMVKHDVGNVYFGLGLDNFIANIFDPKSSLSAIDHTVERICKFCSFELPSISRAPLQAWLLIPFYEGFLGKGIQQLYRVDFEQYKPVLGVLLRLYKRDMSSNYTLPLDTNIRNKINNLFFDNTSLIEFFLSNDEILKIIEPLYLAYHQAVEHNSITDNEMILLAEDLKAIYLNMCHQS
ncbi:TPA: hypothetical protein RUZ12_003614 [Vibrio cholerae]|uniref:hypothetical protein n=1 Tax=Vibrio cholerae TaxID=666 RepID=UPI0028D99C1A|nr:hypothetical protein [Vibrio cholerae]